MAKRIIETVVEYEKVSICRTASQMEQICCEPTDELECCEISDGSWNGYTAQELLEEYHPNLDSLGRDEKGRYVVVQLEPRKNPCGQKIIEYDLSSGKCCDGVPLLEWDFDSSASVLPAGGTATIFINGSDGRELTVTTSSSGTWFSNGRRSIVTALYEIDVYSSSSFCGRTAVSITDGCSDVSSELRSTLGVWNGSCYTYMWIPLAAGIWRNDVPLPNVDNCFYNTAKGQTSSTVHGTVYTYLWDGSDWFQLGSGGLGSSYEPGSLWDTIVTDILSRSIPNNQHPRDYAPNGPSDVFNLGGTGPCSGVDKCIWECS